MWSYPRRVNLCGRGEQCGSAVALRCRSRSLGLACACSALRLGREYAKQRGRGGAKPLEGVFKSGAGRRAGLARRFRSRSKPARQLRSESLGLLQERARNPRIDEYRSADRQDGHVRPNLVQGRIAISRPIHGRRYVLLGPRSLGHQDRRLRCRSTRTILQLSHPHDLVDHQDCDQQDKDPCHDVRRKSALSPPAARSGIGQVDRDQPESYQRDQRRGGSSGPASQHPSIVGSRSPNRLTLNDYVDRGALVGRGPVASRDGPPTRELDQAE